MTEKEENYSFETYMCMNCHQIIRIFNQNGQEDCDCDCEQDHTVQYSMFYGFFSDILPTTPILGQKFNFPSKVAFNTQEILNILECGYSEGR